jgi:hypothetical protein
MSALQLLLLTVTFHSELLDPDWVRIQGLCGFGTMGKKNEEKTAFL